MAYSLLEQANVKPQKDPKFGPLFIDKAFTGYYTNRSPLHDPSDIVTSRFYGGRPDALIDGLNIELTNALTLARRPGTSLFSSATYPTPPLTAFGFENNAGGSDTITLLIDTAAAVYIDNQNGTKTLLFNKAAGAGQTGFVSIGNVCYMGDGIDLFKYTPANPNGLVWNWGIAAPTTQPTLVITQSGNAAVGWKQNTYFTTMGLVLDSNGGVEMLNSVALLSNTGQFGTTGQGQPAWNNTIGGTTTESSGSPITWKCISQITQWLGSTFYPNGACIYDPTTNCVFCVLDSGGNTSGTKKPNFNAVPGSATQDGGIQHWANLGIVGTPPANGQYSVAVWKPSTTYTRFGAGPNMVCVEPVLPNVTNTAANTTQPVYVQTAEATGTSGSGYTPPWPTTNIGTLTSDNQVQWIYLGSATWQASHAYTPWAQGQAIFSVVSDGASTPNFWVCTAIEGTGVSGASLSFPASPTYGQQLQDNVIGGVAQVTWTCVGPCVLWAANSLWYLPVNGFAPPTPDQAYGGASIVITQGGSQYTQFVTVSGESGSPQPATWGTVPPATTPDNGVTWTVVGAYSQFSLQWSTGFTYAYSYMCRESSDPYCTTGLLTFDNLNNPNTILPLVGNVPGLSTPLAPTNATVLYFGGGTGAVSSASPVTVMATGSNTGAVVTVSGAYSSDPQVDTIIIWRSADGGGSSNMFDLIHIPNIPALAGKATWSFNDFLPSVPTTIAGVEFPGLDLLSPAPIDGVNDPPPAGFIPHAYHFQRIWGPVGTDVNFSGGPDTLVGNPNEAFSVDDEFPFLSVPQRCLHTPQGLIVFTRADIEIIAGGPSTASFYQTTLAPGVGLGNFNAIDIYAGEIYFFSSDAALMTLSPSLQVAWTGFPVANVLANFTPADVYLTVHHNGTDRAIFIADGSTQWLRLNPHQSPGIQPGLASAVWSPPGKIAAGVGMVQSVQTSPGVFTLLIGATTDNQSILKRDLTVWADNGTSYEAYFTMGSLVLAHPGETAYVPFIESDFAQIGTKPTVSILQNEISGTFTALTSFVYDPPIVYQATGAPTSYWPLRFYLIPSVSPMRMRHCQIKVDYGSTDTVMNECYNMTIYGQRVVEA